MRNPRESVLERLSWELGQIKWAVDSSPLATQIGYIDLTESRDPRNWIFSIKLPYVPKSRILHWFGGYICSINKNIVLALAFDGLIVAFIEIC